jgi:hypothetical protein
MVSTEASPAEIRPLFTHVCLDGLLVTQDTAAMTGRSMEGLSSARHVASWVPAVGKTIDDA